MPGERCDEISIYQNVRETLTLSDDSRQLLRNQSCGLLSPSLSLCPCVIFLSRCMFLLNPSAGLSIVWWSSFSVNSTSEWMIRCYFLSNLSVYSKIHYKCNAVTWNHNLCEKSTFLVQVVKCCKIITVGNKNKTFFWMFWKMSTLLQKCIS